ncbi:hypothetical protein [Rathayibacter rathayi]|uniref:Helix-turn-helix domain containing protein n=1 Tax=Rathayibacter rathayi TaxID=33887 RepID=A0ABD6W7I1_RATRA|nr:hypothetical protein [Rathayibacter rathayi]MWV75850.1 hypothetical protein [Rathayibacter rathayi NCPPB 2980 = VKM Ac-1601]PPF11939.1 hypothetical protein C5C04_11415 [Rathayibacter rathayi]PPF45177.1 hypothetical protein C5C08_12545 [Rathayibacter rathayi]PPF77714.1 hypothetical protein C5C14_12095 [Rathayibacter rathayi]PPG11555.1 hypothetical protein C5C11_12110 [Rathayibacter rathayi]
MSADKPTPAELIAQLVDRGMSKAEIAKAIHRDTKMIWKVLNGKTSGEKYRRTLEDIVNTGTSDYVPHRPRRSDGSLVPVRAKDGGMRVPEDDGGTIKKVPPRTRFSTKTTYGDDGFRLHEITLPKSRNTPGRARGADEILSKLRNTARGQRFGDRDVKMTVTLKDGKTIPLGGKGGYHSTSILQSIRDHDKAHGTRNDIMGWVTDQLTGNAVSPPPEHNDAGNIVGVTITAYRSDVSRGRNRGPDSEANPNRRRPR